MKLKTTFFLLLFLFGVEVKLVAIPMVTELEGSDTLVKKGVVDQTRRIVNLSTGTSEASSSRSESEVAFSETNNEGDDDLSEGELYQDIEASSFSGELAKQLAIDERIDKPSLISRAALLLQAAKKVTLDVRPEVSELASNSEYSDLEALEGTPSIEQRIEETQAAKEAYRKSKEALKEKEEALLRGDQAAAELNEKIAQALGGDIQNPGAGYAYLQEDKNRIQGNVEAASAWYECAEAYTASADALLRRDKDAAILYEKKAKVLGGTNQTPGAGIAYEFAAINQAEGNQQVAAINRLCAKMYEEQTKLFQIEIYPKEDKTSLLLIKKEENRLQNEVEKVEQMAKNSEQLALGGYPLKLEVDNGFEIAADNEDKKNIEILNSKRKKASEEANATLFENEFISNLYRKKEIALGEGNYIYAPGAIGAYRLATIFKEHLEAAEAFRKCGKVREKQVEAIQAAIEAYSNKVVAELHQKRSQAFGGSSEEQGACFAYALAAYAKLTGHIETVEKAREGAKCYESQAEALKDAIDSYKKGSKDIFFDLHKKRAQALGGDHMHPGAGWAYTKAAYNQLTGGKEEEVEWLNKIVKICKEEASALKAAIDAYEKGNNSIAKLHQKRAQILRGGDNEWEFINTYEEAYRQQRSGNKEIAENWYKISQIHEEAAVALKDAAISYLKGNNDVAALHEEQCKVLLGDSDFIGARGAYISFAYMQEVEKKEEIELWRKSAQCYESQADVLKEAAVALVRGDKEAVRLYKKRAQAIGGSKEAPGAASTYFNIAGMQVTGEKEGEAALKNSARCYENQSNAFKAAIEALFLKDKPVVQLYEKMAKALGGDYKTLGAGIAYCKLAGMQMTKNTIGETALKKCAQCYENQASSFKSAIEALFLKDKDAAQLYEKRAQLLGGDDQNQGAGYAYEKVAILQTRRSTIDLDEWHNVARHLENQTDALKSAIKAHEEGKVAMTAEKKAKEMIPEDIEAFEVAWNEATNRAHQVQQQWEHVINLFKVLQKVIPASLQAKWNSEFQIVQYNKSYYETKPLYLEAIKGWKVAKAAREKALMLDPEDSNFESRYIEAINAAHNVKQQWESVANCYKELQATIPKDKQFKWNEELQTVEYNKVLYTAQPFSIEAQKRDIIAAAKYDRVFALDLRNFSNGDIQEAWREAIATAEHAEKTCRDLVKRYADLSETVPKSKKGSWDKNISTATLWAERAKANKDVLLDCYHALLLSSEDLSFNNGWNKVSNAVTVAEGAYKSQLKEHGKTALRDDNWHKCQYWASFYSAMPGLITARKTEKIATAARNIAQVFCTEHPDFESVSNRAREEATKAKQAWEVFATTLTALQSELSEKNQERWQKRIDAAKHQEKYWAEQDH